MPAAARRSSSSPEVSAAAAGVCCVGSGVQAGGFRRTRVWTTSPERLPSPRSCSVQRERHHGRCFSPPVAQSFRADAEAVVPRLGSPTRTSGRGNQAPPPSRAHLQRAGSRRPLGSSGTWCARLGSDRRQGGACGIVNNQPTHQRVSTRVREVGEQMMLEHVMDENSSHHTSAQGAGRLFSALLSTPPAKHPE